MKPRENPGRLAKSTEASRVQQIITDVRATEQIVVDTLYELSIALLLIYGLIGGLR